MARALLNNVPLLGDSPIQWVLVPGTRPHTQTFHVSPKDLPRLVGNQRAITLTIDKLQVQGLYVLHAAPGPNPHIAAVTVADRRWLWEYAHVTRRYNMRRKVGYLRLENPAREQLRPVKEDVWYAAFSTNDGQRFSSFDILTAILDEIVRSEGDRGPGLGYIVEGTIKGQLQRLPVENLVLDDSLPTALDRTLAVLPEAAVTVGVDGFIRVYSKSSGAERGEIQRLKEKTTGGHAKLINKQNIRPVHADVLYTREFEVRFDFVESESYRGTASRKKDDRFMDNVLPVPDFELKLTTGETVCQGTWITFDQALAAWNSGKNGPISGLGRPLDYADIRKAMVPYMDLWGPLRMLGNFAPDADWAARVAAIQTHYRRTFRINQRWMDRILNLHDYRVATIDPETGQRAPAAVYANYAYLASMRSLIKESKADTPLSWVLNQIGYPDKIGEDGVAVINARTKIMAAATAHIIDHDQGVVQLNFAGDPTRTHEQILPSWVELSGGGVGGGARPVLAGPTPDITRWKERPITFDSIPESNVGSPKIPQLTGNHRVAIIISAVPGSPNTDHQLHRVRVKPGDVARFLPVGAQQGLKNALGPPIEIRVGGNVETARIAWVDSRSKDIEAAFGIGDKPPNLEGLVVNEGPQGEIEGFAASITNIALTKAARAYAQYADRWQGNRTGDLDGQVKIAGWASTVAHGLETDGELLTMIDLPTTIPLLDPFSLMDSSTRALSLKLAQPGK